MTTVESDIAEYLEDQSVGTVGTNIFCTGHWPNAPSLCMLVTAYGGMAPDTTHDSKVVKRPGVQILTRGGLDTTDYATARAMADAASTALHAVTNTTIEGTVYLSIWAEQEPTYLGRPKGQNARPMWSQNFSVMKR